VVVEPPPDFDLPFFCAAHAAASRGSFRRKAIIIIPKFETPG